MIQSSRLIFSLIGGAAAGAAVTAASLIDQRPG
jgi:hypothetical protein